MLYKQYELKDHLGNVRSVISDIKNPVLPEGFEAKLLASYDYFPFGMEMPNFGYKAEEYRYGFNGMEKDNEMKGKGNSCDYGARMYDPRAGRFFSVDRYCNYFPDNSPYNYVVNNPIYYLDIGGDFHRVHFGKQFVVIDNGLIYIDYKKYIKAVYGNNTGYESFNSYESTGVRIQQDRAWLDALLQIKTFVETFNQNLSSDPDAYQFHETSVNNLENIKGYKQYNCSLDEAIDMQRQLVLKDLQENPLDFAAKEDKNTTLQAIRYVGVAFKTIGTTTSIISMFCSPATRTVGLFAGNSFSFAGSAAEAYVDWMYGDYSSAAWEAGGVFTDYVTNPVLKYLPVSKYAKDAIQVGKGLFISFIFESASKKNKSTPKSSPPSGGESKGGGDKAPDSGPQN